MEKRRESYLNFGFDDQFKPETFRTCDEVNERITKEIDFLTENHMLDEIADLKRVCDHLKENGIPYFCSGATGSLYTLFDLGITKTNPLESHYFCPKCRTFEFISNELIVDSGYELSAKTCPECGTELHRDGHNIPFEVFKGSEPLVYLSVSDKYYSMVLSLLKEAIEYRTPKEVGTFETHIGHIVLQKHPIVTDNKLSITKYPTLPEGPISVADQIEYALNKYLNELKFTEPTPKVPITNFTDVIKLWGLKHATYETEALNTLFRHGIQLSELPVFYDEVYLEAIKWGYTQSEALTISRKVHYGTIKDEDIILAPTYIRHWLPKITYMFPKSHALELFHLKSLAWRHCAGRVVH